MNTEKFLLTVGALMGGLLWCAAAAEAQAVLYVDANAAGPTHDGSSWCSAYVHLQDALMVAAPGDEIRVADGTYKPDQGTGRTPGDQAASFQLANGVTLRGGFAGCGAGDPDERDIELYETIISGDLSGDDGPDFANNDENSYHLFYHYDLGLDGSAILDGFTITGGNAHGDYPHLYGAGMYNYLSSPTVTDCTFRGNSGWYGGAIYNHLSSPTITNGVFSGNSANSHGGGMYNIASSVTLADCTFTGNWTSGGNGGALHNASGSDAVVTNCTFSGNSSRWGWAGSGGGMYNNRSSPTVMNCTFTGNSAHGTRGGGGGGLHYESGYAIVVNCILWGNTALEGAQIYGSTPTVSYSLVQDGYPGTANIDADPRFVDDGHWDDNGTPGVSGDDFWVEGDYHLQADSPCVNAGNNDVVSALTDFEGDGRIQQCRVDMGVDETPYYRDCNGNGAVDACEVEEGAAEDCNGNGAPDGCEPGGLEDCNTNGTADLCDIHAGVSPDCNGNAVPDECEGLPTLVLYVDQSASGGLNDGSNWTDAYLELGEALHYVANCASGFPPDVWVAEGVYMPDPTGLADPREAAFQLTNEVAVYGGFPSGGSSFDVRDPITFETVLSGDIGTPGQTGDNCYHVFFHPENLRLDDTAVLDGFTITGGNAAGSWAPKYFGGGMYNQRSSPTVTDCTFTGNSAAGPSAYGGGMYNFDGSNPTVKYCTFSGNSSERGGSGMYNDYDSSPTVMNCTFRANSGGEGGGIYNRFRSSPTVTQCAFSDNSAYRGGGMHNDHSDPTVTSCTFSGNSADFRGGGMYNVSGSEPIVTNCTFSGNWASSSDGGGMYNKGSSNPSVTNCVFSGNSAANGDGGGMYNRGFSAPTVRNCTFSGNRAGGYAGGVFNEASSPTLTNSIIWGNTSPQGWQIYNDGPDATPSVTSSCIQGGYPGTDNIDTDPLFVDYGFWDDNGTPGVPGDDLWVEGDYHLQANSPCINVGDNDAVSVPTDFEGDDRIRHCVVDMGADETPYFRDCNTNGVADACDLEQGTSDDCQLNGVPDECEPVEACCLTDSMCLMVDPQCCDDLGGAPQGQGPECSGLEACCLPDDSCVMADALCCVIELGGVPHGPATACTGPEACCFDDNTCEMLDPPCCARAGGTPQGAERTCKGLEACCLPDGRCVMADALCCVSELGGVPRGAGSQCGDEEACCLSNGTCMMADVTCCSTMPGGAPGGPGSQCGGMEACCLNDGITCFIADATCCAREDGGEALGPGTSCLDSDSDDVPDCHDQCPGVDDAVSAVRVCERTGNPCESDRDCLNGQSCIIECRSGIPALSEWGLVILTLILVTAGRIYFGCRPAKAV